MNYSKIYNALVAYRKQSPADGYTENHHIVMRSMGGSDTKDNLVRLTGREHWIAHLLLYKIHRNSQSIHACNMMSMRCEERGIAYVKNSRVYEFIRIQHAKFMSDKNKASHKGEGNSQYGTCWICNIEKKQNKKISKDNPIPDGWIFGRNKWKHAEKFEQKNKRKGFNRPHREDSKIKMSISKKGNKSLSGKKWITDGIVNKVIDLYAEEIPIGFILGKKKRC
jgi:hypothetical protein